MMLLNHLILCCSLLLPSVFPNIQVFSNESAHRIRWANYWNFSFTISPCNEYSGLISFSIDWFVLLAVLGNLSSLFQHYNLKASVLFFFLKASILWCLEFFMVPLWYPYMTTGKTIALTIQTFVGKVMSLLFSTLSMFAIPFLPRRKYLLISWLQSPSIVILECKKIKSVMLLLAMKWRNKRLWS